MSVRESPRDSRRSLGTSRRVRPRLGAAHQVTVRALVEQLGARPVERVAMPEAVDLLRASPHIEEHEAAAHLGACAYAAVSEGEEEAQFSRAEVEPPRVVMMAVADRD